jgi:hypothetical protein
MLSSGQRSYVAFAARPAALLPTAPRGFLRRCASAATVIMYLLRLRGSGRQRRFSRAAAQPRANAPPLGTMRMPSRARRTSARMSRGVVLAAGRRTPPASQMRSGLQKAGDLNPQRLYAAHSARGRSCEKRTLSATSPRRLLFCRLRRRAVRGGRWRTLRERSQSTRRAEQPPAAAPTAVWPWRAAREPRRDSRRPSGTESASREARDVAGGTNWPQTGSPPLMALSMALGGLSLGAAPLNARSALGCTDGLRVRFAVQGRHAAPRAADARAALPAGAGRAGCCCAAAHGDDGGSAGAWRRAGPSSPRRSLPMPRGRSRAAAPRFASRAWAASSRRSTAWSSWTRARGETAGRWR